MDDIGRTAGQVEAMYKCRDCRAFQRDVHYLEHLLRKERARGRQTREWRITLCQALDEAHEKLAELQPREESYSDTEEEIWQPEDWEKEADCDEDTQQPEDCEEDSETLSSTKILTETTKQNQELQFERSTNKALLDELETLRASNNELIQRYEADILRAEQQASHLKAELEKAHKSQMQSFQAEQNLLRLQMMEEMRCLRKSAAEEKMLLQREVEELTSQLSMKKEREDVKHQEWKEEKDEEKQEEKVGEEQQEKEEEKWGEEAGGESVDKTADETVLNNQQDPLSDALPASEPVETETSEETPKKKKSSIWKRIRQCLGLRRRKKQRDAAPHN
ncbi:unnamed protein product [Pleuronectes platessa]|uniref:Uncharacterized protein n=1 Tax=Pleuronectes platessa TaxID=8262 RepID=A0A9N7VMP3_PLEPL|nr:unnamed protein product [Pleuronectes platessa]